MASISKRTNKKKPSSYQVAVRIKGADPFFQTASTAKAAEEAGKEAEAKIRREIAANEDPRSWLPKSGDVLDEKFRKTIEKFSKARPNNWMKKTIPGLLKVMGDPTIRDLTPAFIENYIVRARKTQTICGPGYAWMSITQQLCAASVILKWRHRQLNIAPPVFVVRTEYYKPALENEGLDKTALNNQRNRRLSPSEEMALNAEFAKLTCPAAAHYQLLQKFAVQTGGRLQELVWAEWSEIDPSMEWWTIPKMHSKTRTERTMMLTDEAMDVVIKLKELADPDNPKIFHKLGKKKSVSTAFGRIAARAGLKNYVFHDNRHEGLSRFVLNQPKIPVKAVMEMAGHSDLAMLNRYVRLRPHELAPLMIRRPRTD